MHFGDTRDVVIFVRLVTRESLLAYMGIPYETYIVYPRLSRRRTFFTTMIRLAPTP
jgi:hypothetical protein